MARGYISEIRMFAFDAVPERWMPCNGQELQIRSHPALYSLLGTAYGGNGHTTFQLPDLRAKIPVHQSERQGVGNRVRTASASDPFPTESQPFLAFNFCICIDGVFPHRP